MGQIADEPVRTALDKLKTLSNDDEARRLAFVRERALLDERSLLKDAHDEGWEEGRLEALRLTASNLIQATTLDDAAISEITGLDIDNIAALRQKG